MLAVVHAGLRLLRLRVPLKLISTEKISLPVHAAHLKMENLPTEAETAIKHLLTRLDRG
jgi:hypothetical protein